MKIFNYLNGIFYVLYGLFGTFLPFKMAGLMGWELSLLGLHQVRAISLVMAVLGAISIISSSKLKDQRPLTFIIVFITLSFAAGRLLGLMIDGLGPMQTYHELGIEFVWVAIGAFLYKRGQ